MADGSLCHGELPEECEWPGRLFASVGCDASRVAERLRQFAASCGADAILTETDVMDLIADVIKLERELVKEVQNAWHFELRNGAWSNAPGVEDQLR